MIKAILFDMVGVLVFKKENYSAKTPDEINTENIEKLFNHIDDNKLILDIKQNLKLNNAEIEDAAHLIPEKYEKFEDLWKLLPELKKKYKLAVINNGNSIALKYWKERFDFSIFDIFVNSAEEGIKKPDPKIFLLTCQKLGVSPQECLFMDDSLENIEAAKKLGMQTIWWSKKTSREIAFSNFLNKTFWLGKNSVFSLLIYKQKLLLFHRDNIDRIPYPDHWHLPGGLIEKGETPLQGIKRELKEEITKILDKLQYLGKFNIDAERFTHTFIAVVNENEAQMFKLGPGEGQEIKFFSLKEISKLKITNALKLRLEKYKNIINEKLNSA